MITPSFKKAYDRLNPEQRKAVDEIDGPVMVVAGPGTGKTEVLTLRIANILLKTDTKPEQVLALTFTDAASSNMRKRLSNIIGAPAYRVRIQTFHSFCNDILQGYPEYFPHVVGSVPITEVEATSILEKIIEEADISVLRPWGDPLLYLGAVIRKIEELKREGVDPEQFEKLVGEAEKEFSLRTDIVHEKGVHKGKMKSEAIEEARKIEKNKELALIYSEYQKKLVEKRLYDWSDMIIEVLRALKDKKRGDLKIVLQETHQYILVDEHQDTNNAQNQILELLSDFHQNPNIFVVGDHKQAIFRFQGASVENFLYFKKLYPEAILIDLFRNYRSSQGILDTAHSLIPSEVHLLSNMSKMSKTVFDSKVSVAKFKNSSVERFWIVEQAKKLEGETAIIYRSNKEAFPVAFVLRKAGIAYSIESDEDLFSDQFVKKLVIILEAVHGYGDSLYLAPLLHVEEMGLDPLEVYKLIRSAKNKRKDLCDLLKDDLPDFCQRLEKWVKDSKERSLPEFVEQVFRESGLLESAIKSRDAEAFLGVERIFEEAGRIDARGGTLSDFVGYLETLRRHDILLKKPKRESKPGSIRLMTAHRSKGLEFDNVFITNASEKSFGGRNNRDLLPLINTGPTSQLRGVTSEEINDERRLFYVALTRAKKNIFITYHESDESGKEILPSVFLSELKPEIVEKVDTTEFNQKIEKNKDLLYGAGDLPAVRQVDKEFISELFYKEQFSVTALNNYLECPWKYFYRNLLRIPYVQEKYLLYGTAMHAAVEEFFKAKLTREVDADFLLECFEKKMKDLPLSPKEMKDTLKRGRGSLSIWYKERSNSWLLPYKLEQSLYGVEFEGVRLSGKLDKVEFVDGAEVIVTDYKTGKVKSRNEIEGKVASSKGRGNLKRQLNFYKLLLDIYDEGRMNMTKGVIEFLEPNESGKIKFEEFEIKKEEVEELKKIIIKVAGEVVNFSFWNSYCDEKECEYCGYRKLLNNSL